MAQIGYFFTTTSSGASGDQVASYTQSQLARAHEILAACSGFEGVAPSYLNELEVTDGGANTVSVNTGGAVVDGVPYRNSAPEDVTIPSAVGGGNTRIDRVVIRISWASYDVAITRIAGTDAAIPTVPAITQTSGTTYDIKLAQVRVDTSGALNITDERDWAAPHVDGTTIEVKAGGALAIVDGGVDTTQIATDAVTTAKIATGAVDTDELATAAVTSPKIAAGAVDTNELATDAVTTAKIPNRTRTLYLPVSAGEPSLTIQTLDGHIPYMVLTGSGYDEIEFTFLAPADLVTGSVTIKYEVFRINAGSGDVLLYCPYRSHSTGDDLNSGSWSNVQTTWTPSATSYEREQVTVGSFSVTAGDLVAIAPARWGSSGSDTFNNNVGILGVVVEYTADS